MAPPSADCSTRYPVIAEPPLSVGAAHVRSTTEFAVGTPFADTAVKAVRASGAPGKPYGVAIAIPPVKLQAPDVYVVTIVPVSSQPDVTAETRNQ